jgi:hypothetical protein
MPGFGSADAAGPLAAGAPRTLTRNLEPVILTGESLPSFAGTPVGQLFVYAFDGKNWRQIPAQVDEVNTSTGSFVAQEDGLLDSNDQIAFMASDTGRQAPSGTDLTVQLPINPIWYEIKVTDPISATNGWVYIVSSQQLTSTNTTDYVDFDNTTGRMIGQNYVLGLTNHPWADYLTLGGSSVDILDRNKLRIACAVPFICPLTEESGNLTIPHALIKDGNVRIIVRDGRVIGYGSMVSWSTVTPLTSLLAGDIRVSFDFSAEASGNTLYNAAVPAGVTIDGANDIMSTTPASPWFQVTTITGTVVQVADLGLLGGTPTLSNFYEDSAVSDPADTGDKLHYGEVGIVAQYPPLGFPATLTYNFNLYMLPGKQANVGATYQKFHDHALATTVIRFGEVAGTANYMPMIMAPGTE